MNNRTIILTALAALTLTGCNSESELTADSRTLEAEAPTAVDFGVYMGRSTVTRAEPVVGGTTAPFDKTADLADTESEDRGFGVIAYYTGTDDYSSWTKAAPNFMYNERIKGTVSGSDVTWDYATPANRKYWPNEVQAGDIDGTDQTLSPGTNGGKISFFAYAPYVDVNTSTGTKGATTNNSNVGILALSANNATTAPSVTYKLDETGKNVVDLLWGAAASNGQNVLGTDQTGKTLDGGKAAVNVDLTKQKTDGHVAFNFKHALAKVGGKSAEEGTGEAKTYKGGVRIHLDVDAAACGGETPADAYKIADNTRVHVEKIVFGPAKKVESGSIVDDNDKKIAMKGTLDLTTGLWTASTDAADKGTISQSVVVGTSATEPNTLADAIAYKKIGGGTGAPASWDALTDGVTHKWQGVYDRESSPLIFIPNEAGATFSVTIVYYVRTKDDHLDQGYTEVCQEVVKNITFSKLELNKRYGLDIHLGLTSVKFTATVADWADETEEVSDGAGGTTTVIKQTDVELPKNVN